MSVNAHCAYSGRIYVFGAVCMLCISDCVDTRGHLGCTHTHTHTHTNTIKRRWDHTWTRSYQVTHAGLRSHTPTQGEAKRNQDTWARQNFALPSKVARARQLLHTWTCQKTIRWIPSIQSTRQRQPFTQDMHETANRAITGKHDQKRTWYEVTAACRAGVCVVCVCVWLRGRRTLTTTWIYHVQREHGCPCLCCSRVLENRNMDMATGAWSPAAHVTPAHGIAWTCTSVREGADTLHLMSVTQGRCPFTRGCRRRHWSPRLKLSPGKLLTKKNSKKKSLQVALRLSPIKLS